jgi:hypothetical protein
LIAGLGIFRWSQLSCETEKTVNEAHPQTPKRYCGYTAKSRFAVENTPENQPSTQPDVLRIIIEPTKNGRKWTARIGDRVLCVAAAPFVKSARLLLAEGYPAETVIEMWRPGTNAWALRGRVGPVASVVLDGEKVPRRAKNGSLTRERPRGSAEQPVRSRSSSTRFWRAE